MSDQPEIAEVQEEKQPETRKRKEGEEEEKEKKKKEDGEESSKKKERKHRRVSRGPGGGAAGLAGLLGALLGGPGGHQQPQEPLTPAQRACQEILPALKVATKMNVSMENRVEVLRRTLALVETHRPPSWDGIDERITELRDAHNAASAMLYAQTPSALASLYKAAESSWPMAKSPYNSYRWAIKIVKQMARQKALQLALE